MPGQWTRLRAYFSIWEDLRVPFLLGRAQRLPMTAFIAESGIVPGAGLMPVILTTVTNWTLTCPPSYSPDCPSNQSLDIPHLSCRLFIRPQEDLM